MAEPDSSSTSVDALLERYLGLLDEYTRLRDALNGLQGSLFQNIARANFSAERGVRYGQDFYDERMQATRRLRIVEAAGGNQGSLSLRFEVHGPVLDKGGDSKAEAGVGNGKGDGLGHGKETKDGNEDEGELKVEAEGQIEDFQENQADEKKKSPQPKPRDPLRWFGLVTPTTLRLAQTQAVQAVEDIIPRLASVSAEMAAVEIEVRRARKRRAKAEAAAEKKAASLVDVEGRHDQAVPV